MGLEKVWCSMSALSALRMSDGMPKADGGMNFRRLDRGDVELNMPVAGIEGIGSDKSIVLCREGVEYESGRMSGMATRSCKADRKSEATDNGVR